LTVPFSVALLDDTEDVDPVATTGTDPLVVNVPAVDTDVPAEFVPFTQYQYFVPADSPVIAWDTDAVADPVWVEPTTVVAAETASEVPHAHVTVELARAGLTVPFSVAVDEVIDVAAAVETAGVDWAMVTVRVDDVAWKNFVRPEIVSLLDAPIWQEPAE
jgi:hypothetical protein